MDRQLQFATTIDIDNTISKDQYIIKLINIVFETAVHQLKLNKCE